MLILSLTPQNLRHADDQPYARVLWTLPSSTRPLPEQGNAASVASGFTSSNCQDTEVYEFADIRRSEGWRRWGRRRHQRSGGTAFSPPQRQDFVLMALEFSGVYLGVRRNTPSFRLLIERARASAPIRVVGKKNYGGVLPLRSASSFSKNWPWLEGRTPHSRGLSARSTACDSAVRE